MSRTIEGIPDTSTKEEAAKHFQVKKHHHAFVLDKYYQWVGLLTVWDVAFGMAREDRTWPWNQGAADYFVANSSPRIRKKALSAPAVGQKGLPEVEPHSFLGIAGADEAFTVSPASVKKETRAKQLPDVEPHSFLGIAGSSE